MCITINNRESKFTNSFHIKSDIVIIFPVDGYAGHYSAGHCNVQSYMYIDSCLDGGGSINAWLD